jgi:hypothetical protein
MTPQQKDRQVLHDFANEGDCPNCGDLQVLIDKGLVKPCFEWERVAEKEEADPKAPLVSSWDGC